ncbi:hypothetical protein [Leptospira semungkisensis]|nr:hypothetical protein [Leptospira semungkisensis]
MSENLKSKLKKAESKSLWSRGFKACWNLLPHRLRMSLVAMSGQSDLDF